MFGRKPSDNSQPNEESNMTGLIKIGCHNPSRQMDVVFVHGLGGHRLKTWHPAEKLDNDSWLYWLGEDLKDVGIWTFGYKAEFSQWKGKAMPRFDQARNLIKSLENEHIGEDKSLIFVTHSLGGLLVKEVLRSSDTFSRREFIDKIQGIVFLATPHNGSHLANTVGILHQILRTTVSVEELENNNTWLRDLDSWYRQKVNKNNYQISTEVYYEAWDTLGYKVVDEGSADPKLLDVMPVPIDADHITIAKPKSRADDVYKGVRNFIQKHLSPAKKIEIINKLNLQPENRFKSDDEIEELAYEAVEEIKESNLQNANELVEKFTESFEKYKRNEEFAKEAMGWLKVNKRALVKEAVEESLKDFNGGTDEYSQNAEQLSKDLGKYLQLCYYCLEVGTTELIDLAKKKSTIPQNMDLELYIKGLTFIKEQKVRKIEPQEHAQVLEIYLDYIIDNVLRWIIRLS
jgi:predicted alpha/beta hydrolase family esterase